MEFLEEVHVGSMDPERFRAVLGERFGEVERGMEDGRVLFRDRSIWHVNKRSKPNRILQPARTAGRCTAYHSH